MQGGVEIAGKYAQAYAKAPKKDKGWILDELCSVTGWSRDNAHRRLVTASQVSIWLQEIGAQGQSQQVLPRSLEGSSAGVGGQRWAVRQDS